jgi:hypothetical protein
MLRWFALTVTGCFALYGAWHFHVMPLAPHAPERTGWLFQQFGQQGVAVGTLFMAIVFIVIGLVGMLRSTHRLRAVREARIFAASSSRGASQHTQVEDKGGSQAGIRSAFIGLIFLVVGGGIAYFGLYLPFVTGQPHDIKASFAAPLAIGCGLALLFLGQDFGPTMYRRKDGLYIPTVVGAVTLIVLLGIGLGLDWVVH